MILSFFPLIIKTYNHIQNSLSTDQDFEWNLFLIQLRKEIRTSDEWGLSGNKLNLFVNQEMVMYEQYGSSLRRRVDNKGHEVVLQNLKEIRFTNIQNEIILLHAQFKNNHLKEIRIIPIPPIKQEIKEKSV